MTSCTRSQAGSSVVSIESSSVSVLGGTLAVGDLGLLEDAVVAALTTGNNNFLDKTLRPLAENVDEELLEFDDEGHLIQVVKGTK
mgnify:CR=1 FL=1